jgi:hypothetical protein
MCLLEGAVEVLVRRSRLGSKDLPLCFQRCWHLRMSRSFPKASSEHYYSASSVALTDPAAQPAPAEVPCCACMCLCSNAMVCSVALHLAGIVASGCFAASTFFFDGCFAVVVAGLHFGSCFAAESVMDAPLYGCFAAGGVFFLDGCLAVCGSLADALPSLALWPPLW